MAMLCVQSVLQATNTHYVHIEDKQMKPSLATILCMMDKPHLVSYPEAEAHASFAI